MTTLVATRPTVTLREAIDADVPRILQMVEDFRTSSIYQRYVGANPEKVAETVNWLLHGGLGAIFVAEQDERLIGMLGLVRYQHPLSGMLSANELFWWLDPAHRGWGGWLLRRAEKWAKSHGCEAIQMIAPIDKPRVMEIYERLGYERVEIAFQKELT